MILGSALFKSNLIRSFIPVGWDLLHDELHHVLGVAPSLADKTAEASTVFQQHVAALSQHLVRKTQYVMCSNLTRMMRWELHTLHFHLQEITVEVIM